MKKLLSVIIILIAVGCSAQVDTSKLTPDEYFDYIKKLYDEEEYYDALQHLQSILVQYPGNAVTDDAQYYLGLTYFARSEYILAAYEFSKLIKDIPASPFVPDAQYMLAESYYQLSPSPMLDQKYTQKGIEEFQAFIDFFPTDKRVEEAETKIKEMNNKLAEKEFNSAVIYEKMEYNTAAIKAFDFVVRTHHDTRFAKEALYRKIKLESEKTDKMDIERDIELYMLRYGNDTEFIDEIKTIKEQIKK